MLKLPLYYGISPVTISSHAVPLAEMETLDPRSFFQKIISKNLATLSKTLAQCFPHGLLKLQKVCSLFKGFGKWPF